MRVVIADIKGRGGFVNKDTVVGGYGSRFRGFSWTTQWIERARKLFQNVPSIHAGYLAAIFSNTGSRWFKNACGSSLIGKWPRPFIMVASQPAMLFATASVSSGVQE